MGVYVFVNDEAKMTSKIIADTEEQARTLLPAGIVWTLDESQTLGGTS